jgi:hypothetical protein
MATRTGYSAQLLAKDMFSYLIDPDRSLGWNYIRRSCWQVHLILQLASTVEGQD